MSCVFGFHGRAIYDVAWSRNGMIASACGDNAVRIFQQVQPLRNISEIEMGFLMVYFFLHGGYFMVYYSVVYFICRREVV